MEEPPMINQGIGTSPTAQAPPEVQGQASQAMESPPGSASMEVQAAPEVASPQAQTGTEIAEVQAEAQSVTYKAYSGYLAGGAGSWIRLGPYHRYYTLDFSARPTSSSGYIELQRVLVYNSGGNNLYYYLYIKNLQSSGTYYDVRGSYDYSTA